MLVLQMRSGFLHRVKLVRQIGLGIGAVASSQLEGDLLFHQPWRQQVVAWMLAGSMPQANA